MADRGLFSLGQAVERPPEAFRSGPTLTGQTQQKTFDSIAALNAWCQANGVAMGARAAPGAYFQACYSIPTDTVAVPSASAWPSGPERAALTEHEWAHARGWQHPGEERPPLDMKKLHGLLALGVQAPSTGSVAPR